VRAVGIKVLKNKLSEYIRLAQGGEVILVTDRDRVVAELVPPREGRSPVVSDAVLAELVRRGWVTPAARPLTGSAPRAPVARFAELMRELDADRADR
jgi:antitoxin (DNA-binding transcriptional repressor) of toxin-antitoxin stability system